MFNYLYYKLYQASLKSSLRDIPEFMTGVSLGGLISANILVLNALLAKLNILPFLFSTKEQAGVFAFVLIILVIFYYRNKYDKAIYKKYSQESDKVRIRGNIIVVIYVVVSFLSIFIVAFFRSGKL